MTMTDRTDRAERAQAVLLEDPDVLREIVERTVQAILEEEMTAHLGAERYERTGERRGYRNGTKPRTLTTRVGTLELLVHQDRDGTFSTEVFNRHQRTEQALVVSLMEMVCPGGLHSQGCRDHRGVVRHARFQEPGIDARWAAGRRAAGVARAATDRATLSVCLGRCALRACPRRWPRDQPGRAPGQWPARRHRASGDPGGGR